MKKMVLGFLLLMAPWLTYADKVLVKGDYHFSVYEDAQGSAYAVEAYTKQPDQRVFFGITCSNQSPLPVIQILAFDEHVIAESSKLLEVGLRVDGQSVNQNINGILRVVDTADEFSNKIRLEIQSPRKGSLTAYQQDYMALLHKLQAGTSLSLDVKHRRLGQKQFLFSLKGLKHGFSNYMALCE